MSALLISFYLSEDRNHNDLLNVIRQFNWAKISDNSYCVETKKSPKDIFEIFSDFLEPHDQLYIISLTRPYFGQGHVEINKWLSAALPQQRGKLFSKKKQTA